MTLSSLVSTETRLNEKHPIYDALREETDFDPSLTEHRDPNEAKIAHAEWVREVVEKVASVDRFSSQSRGPDGKFLPRM